MHHQPERAAAIGFAEVEFEGVRLGEALELQDIEIAKVTMRQQVGQNIVTMLVPRARRRTGIAAVDNFERRIRRVAGEIFVGENIDSGRMVHGQQLHLIEIDRFFQRLHETETEFAVFFAHRVAGDLDVFRRPRNVALAGPNPVPDHARAQHVSHQFVVGAVPNKQRRTGTAAAVHFEEAVVFHSGNLDFILYDSGRPQHAHHIGLFGLAESDHEVG